ncbi:MAG: aminopeptidase P family N-terminal domain-containing protein [Armatimonadota bacterium]
MRNYRLIEIDWPEFGDVDVPPEIDAAEYRARLAAARQGMEARGLTHLVVYGDREHFANIQYLTGYDPRFEEALLIVRPEGTPLLLVGNEGEGYLPVSPLVVTGEIRAELYQSFSLIDQPRGSSRPLRDILAGEGIGNGSTVGCAGWKYYTTVEFPDTAHMLELPALIVDLLRSLAGQEAVTNVTDLFMHADYGLRAKCSVAELAYLEYAGTRASEAMKRMLLGMREGMRDFELVAQMGYTGEPLNCHVTLSTDDNRDKSLSGPVGAILRRGSVFSSNVAYYGSNVCRTGWIAESADDLPANARDYIEAFAGKYFSAMGEWFRLLRIGTTGDALYRVIADNLPGFGITLPPGHLIHMDEWLSAPVYAGSTIPIQSGMAMQVDVIPVSPVYYSTRMEDGMAIADATLRAELQAQYPQAYARCQARRQFMIDVLGFELAEEVLPLSNIPAIVPPFFLKPRQIFALA